MNKMNHIRTYDASQLGQLGLKSNRILRLSEATVASSKELFRSVVGAFVLGTVLNKIGRKIPLA